MTPTIVGRLSEEVRKKLREIGVSALLMLLKWLIEKLMSNPGRGGDNGSAAE